MKYLILGDIHGVEYWKNVIELENPDKTIFVGDYVDSFTIGVEKQIKNLEKILLEKRMNPDNVVLLLGNHDYHYSDLCGPLEQYSGFKKSTKNGVNKMITKAILNNKIQIAYLLEDKYLITHAGVSNTWLDSIIENFEDKYERLDDYINKAFINSSYLFDFYGTNPYGDNVTQGPLWIRPRSLYTDLMDKYIQIVGHTKQETISHDPEKKLYLIDTFSERTKGEAHYIIIENDEIITKTYRIPKDRSFIFENYPVD